MSTRHLAWASECCGGDAFSNPLEVDLRTGTSQVCRVVCAGSLVKGVCTSKSALWCYDATPVYRAFAREEALRVAHLWKAPPVVLQYLRTGDESIREAAYDAAWAATEDAARVATWAAASDAARAAASDAARAAAWDATWAAARAAAWAAAGAAVRATAGAAVRAAARTAAGAAARKRQNRRLAKLLTAGRRLYGQRVVA